MNIFDNISMKFALMRSKFQYNIYSSFSSDRLNYVVRFRQISTILAYFGFIIFVIGVLLLNSKLTNSAGLLLDVTGVIRIFIDEEWVEILKYYDDEKKYPYGPPSYVTRELFKDTGNIADFVSDDTEDMKELQKKESALFWHEKRGFIFLICGFLGQLIATWM